MLGAKESSGSGKNKFQTETLPGCHVGHSPPTRFVYSFMRWPTISAIFCARWRRRSRSRVVADELEADQDRREDRQPWPLCRVSDGRSRHSQKSLCRHPAADRGTAAAADSRIDVKRSIALRPIKNQRRDASG
jgi:hypothetical protein